MPEIYESFAEIADKFSDLLVDAYGVFWNGDRFFDGSLEILEQQVKQGKKVVAVSNSPHSKTKSIEDYTRRGLIQGKHYTDFVTSGEVLHNDLQKQNLPIAGRKIWIFGTKHFDLFVDTPCQIVENPADADCFYISTPRLTAEQADENSLYEDFFYPSPSGEFDCTTIAPFIPVLKKLYHLGLPAINANPDFTAGEVDTFGDMHYVLRPGSIAETYRKMGGTVIEYGKPHRNFFDYAFKLNDIIPSPAVAMIGDTYRTDIKGAQDAGISGVWCVETGVTSDEIAKGKTLEQLCNGNFDNLYPIKHL